MDAKQFEKYRGEAIYTPEEDTHFATLTLKHIPHKIRIFKMPSQNNKHTRHKIRNLQQLTIKNTTNAQIKF
jgi:hypothetical protein